MTGQSAQIRLAAAMSLSSSEKNRSLASGTARQADATHQSWAKGLAGEIGAATVAAVPVTGAGANAESPPDKGGTDEVEMDGDVVNMGVSVVSCGAG